MLIRLPEIPDDHLASASNVVEVVRPGLHHLAAIIEVFGSVVGRIDLVARRMRELAIDDLVRVLQFLFDRRHGQGAETVAGHAAFVAESLQRFQDGVVAHVAARFGRAGEHPLIFSVHRVQLAKDCE